MCMCCEYDDDVEDLLKSHPVGEVGTNVIVRHGEDGPVGQPCKLLRDGLDPYLNQGHGPGLRANRECSDITGAQVGLVEHVRVRVETEQVARVGGLGVDEQVGKGTGSSRGGNPLVGRALRGVAVVVDGGCPAREDSQPCVPIAGHSGDERVEGVVWVAEHGTSVVTDDILDAVVHPGLDGITVVQTSNGRRNESVGRELVAGPQSNLLHPRNVECNLAVCVIVSGVVEFLMREGVRNSCKGVGIFVEPLGDLVQLTTLQGPVVDSPLRAPEISTGAKRLLELQSGVWRRVVVHSIVWSANSLAGCLVRRVINVAVSVVTNLNKVAGTSRKASVDIGLPSCEVVQI